MPINNDKTNVSSVSSASIPVAERSVSLKEQTVWNIASTVFVQATAFITANAIIRGASSHALKSDVFQLLMALAFQLYPIPT